MSQGVCRGLASGVFINYRGEDSDTTAALIDRELTGWFGTDRVFLDSRSIPAGVDFAEDLLGRLRTCSVLLVVIGPRWLTLSNAAGQRRIDDPQDWIRREIIEATSQGLRVIPVLTGGAALPTEEDLPPDIAGLSRRQYVPLRRRYTSVDLAFLVERITETDPELVKIATAQRAAAKTARLPSAWPAVFSVPLRNPHFIGRDAELDKIRAGLTAGMALTVQALRGMAGVGKTQTAIEYAYRHAHEYDLVWWINAEQPTLITDKLAALATPLGLPEGLLPDDAVRAVCAELAKRSDWLLIFDNAEHPTDLPPVLPRNGGHVLITTRRSGFGSLGSVLDLDVLPRDHAIALLQRRIPTLAAADAGILADLLGCLPLALDQAAGYLDHTQLPASGYLQLLHSRAADLFTRGQVLHHQETIATLWSLTLDRLRTTHPAAVQLATICGYLAPEPIPLDLITGHPDQLPDPLCQVAADPLAMADTIGILLDYSLARRTPTGGLVWHRLTQAVLRHTTPDHSPLTTALILLRTDLPDEIEDAPQNWPHWRQLLSHVLAATEHLPDASPIANDTTAHLLHYAAIYQRIHGRPAAARPLFERALRINETSYGPDHTDVANDLSELGRVLRDLGQPAQARPLFERALQIYVASYGPDHTEVAANLNNLGMVLCALGQPAQARPLFERVLHIREANYGPDHPRVATCLGNLGWALCELGQPAQARPLFERALRINEENYGPDHPKVSLALNRLGLVLRELGLPAQAQPLFERALHIAEASYGPDHPDVATTLDNLGLALCGLGQLTQAGPLFERALHIKETTHGPNHPDLATTLNNLGSVLRDLQQLAPARSLHERALQILEAWYGPDHPFTRRSRHWLYVLDDIEAE